MRREPQLPDPEARSARSAASARTRPALPAASRPRSRLTGEQPQCSHCRLGSPEPCEGCGAPTISRTRQGRPQCQRCYQRPVGTCGRCGRVRTIVRLAVDGDPDLCALCWRGPTVACAEVREGASVPRGAARADAVRLVRAGEAAGMRALRSRATPGGALAGRAGVRHVLPTRPGGQGRCCPECGQTRRLMRYPGYEEPVCRECAGAPAHNLCGRCGG